MGKDRETSAPEPHPLTRQPPGARPRAATHTPSTRASADWCRGPRMSPSAQAALLPGEHVASGGREGPRSRPLARPAAPRGPKQGDATGTRATTHHALGCELEWRVVPDLLQALLSLLPPDLLLLEGREPEGRSLQEAPASPGVAAPQPRASGPRAPPCPASLLSAELSSSLLREVCASLPKPHALRPAQPGSESAAREACGHWQRCGSFPGKGWEPPT